MAARLIGQAVVTDPGGGRASGYALVAASESVEPAEAQLLAVAPQVTDTLHLEASPGPFFSCYPLPSGRWALVRRFVRGIRRGAFNRVVVHTLLVPREVLRTAYDEPWLLFSKSRFRARTGGPELAPAELGEQAAAPDLATVSDLECLLPSDPRVERFALLRRRCELLRRQWDEEELGKKLAEIFAAVVAGRRLLLPQSREAEQLLALAWSALPVSDRLALPWTTHLAEAAGPLFHLANAPDPESVRAAQAEPKQWLVLGSGRGPGDAAGGSDALARIIAGPAPRLTELYEGFRRQGLSLIAGSDRVRRWIDRLEGGEPPPPKRVKKRRADAPIEAIVQAGELARKSSDPHGFLLRETSKLLPREPLARARMVVDLLLSPALRPWVKRLIETEFRDEALRRAGAAVLRVLPRVGELARRGNLLLPIAASLGERWSEDPVRVRRFLHQAADLGRWDAVAALLRASERGRHSLLDDLALRDEHRLLAQIGDAARQPAHRWDLLPFAGRIASSCRRRTWRRRKAPKLRYRSTR